MTEKKRFGTKAQISAERERERRITTAIFLLVILLAAAFSVYFGYTILRPSSGLGFTGPTVTFKSENANPELKAAIVDQLSLTAPNETFIQTATNILEQANYSVDYYSGEKVTVDFYRNLPTLGYSVIILRVHSVLLNGTSPPVGLFTSELVSSPKYVYEGLTDRIMAAMFTDDNRTYYSICPGFVKSDMKDRFNDTLIIMMGCNGLTYTDMAEAFIERGAKTYISWAGSVSASHTDQATTQLLQHLITQHQTVKQGVANTVLDVGRDLAFNNALGYYPLESENYTFFPSSGN
jgi:hypothetical protein